MKIAIPRERRAGENRVAASPETVKKLKALSLEVVVETGAGLGSNLPDRVYQDAGAEIAPDAASALADADIVLKVQRPLLAGEGDLDELALIKRGALLFAILNPYNSRDHVAAYAAAGVNAFAME
ncbi:NAD(P)(+) transhydrogenase (Re/Si-specific) subunit alpha, partial [Azospirillum formosense]|nr:NAD(P)(+) transhydrogenase (Re/Si-specific) subunit alpha [Azospirillum formosense]